MRNNWNQQASFKEMVTISTTAQVFDSRKLAETYSSIALCTVQDARFLKTCVRSWRKLQPDSAIKRRDHLPWPCRNGSPTSFPPPTRFSRPSAFARLPSKLFLAHMSKSQRRRLIEEACASPTQYTRKTITDYSVLEQDIEEANQGYALTMKVSRFGVYCGTNASITNRSIQRF